MTESQPRRVALESAYSGDAEANIEFARNVCHYAVTHGYNPYAMHLFFTQFLNDEVPAERALGITCGLAWTELAEEIWFCLRPGDTLSRGMMQAYLHHSDPTRSAATPRLRLLYFTQDGTLAREGSDEELATVAESTETRSWRNRRTRGE